MSTDQRFIDLYENHNYITAYSMHTDGRVKENHQLCDNFKWEAYGDAQLNCLINHGLKRNMSLLDLGCGTGRLARKVVPYLDMGRYTGLEISQEAFNQCLILGAREGWARKMPTFKLSDGSLLPVEGKRFDVIWAWSVFTHLPPEWIQTIFAGLAMIRWDRFLFSFKDAGNIERIGLKGFSYPFSFFEGLCELYHYRVTKLVEKMFRQTLAVIEPEEEKYAGQ